MKFEGRWEMILFWMAVGGFILFTFPLWVYGLSILGGIAWQMGALPQVLWWNLGLAILGGWGLIGLARRSKLRWPGFSKEKSSFPFSSGPLRSLYQSFGQARGSAYGQEKIMNQLQSLAIDLLTLKRNLPEEEGRKIFRQGDWTDDPELLSFFQERPAFREKRPGILRRRIKSFEPDFLLKSQKVLDRLRSWADGPRMEGNP
jgi:hypothetical protein